jgi:hypothetical protein
VGNLLNDLVFGKIYDENDEVWKWLRHLQEEGVKHIGVSGLLNFFPLLRYGSILDRAEDRECFAAPLPDERSICMARDVLRLANGKVNRIMQQGRGKKPGGLIRMSN